jgi:hypothetical protein
MSCFWLISGCAGRLASRTHRNTICRILFESFKPLLCVGRRMELYTFRGKTQCKLYDNLQMGKAYPWHRKGKHKGKIFPLSGQVFISDIELAWTLNRI